MSEFELVTIALSFIVGFGVTAILTGVVNLLTSPEPVRWDWLPLAWALAIFIDQVNFWFGALFLERNLSLGPGLFWMMVSLAALLFLAGGLILPTDRRRLGGSLLDDFDRFGRRALIPIALFQAAAVVVNVYAGVSILNTLNVMNAALAAVALLVFGLKRRAVQRVLSVAYLLLLVYVVTFIASRPGAI